MQIYTLCDTLLYIYYMRAYSGWWRSTMAVSSRVKFPFFVLSKDRYRDNLKLQWVLEFYIYITEIQIKFNKTKNKKNNGSSNDKNNDNSNDYMMMMIMMKMIHHYHQQIWLQCQYAIGDVIPAWYHSAACEMRALCWQGAVNGKLLINNYNCLHLSTFWVPPL
jgi:hypothetical protein